MKAILKEYQYRKKVKKKHFNKNLIMSEEEEQFVKNSLMMTMKMLEIIVT